MIYFDDFVVTIGSGTITWGIGASSTDTLAAAVVVRVGKFGTVTDGSGANSIFTTGAAAAPLPEAGCWTTGAAGA